MDDFLTQMLAGLAANVLTAILLFIFIDRRLRQQDENYHKLEQARIDAARAAEAARLQRATLLQLFPPLMQRLIDSQRDAFEAALPAMAAPVPPDVSMRATASSLRHFANVQIDTAYLLSCLGVESAAAMSLHADFTNAIAVLALSLQRGEEVERVPVILEVLLSKILKTLPRSSRGKSHCERIGVLFPSSTEFVSRFDTLAPEAKEEALRMLCEVVGHNSAILLEHVNAAFAEQLGPLKAVKGSA